MSTNKPEQGQSSEKTPTTRKVILAGVDIPLLVSFMEQPNNQLSQNYILKLFHLHPESNSKLWDI